MVVVVADDINWFDVDTITTPALDRLMASGTSWRRFYTSPVCSPTRYALQFGRWPRRDNFLNVVESENTTPPSPHPDEALASIGDLFQGRGYLTSIFGKWHTGVQFFAQGGGANPDVSPLFIGYDTWRAGTASNVPNYNLWDRIDDGTKVFGVTSYADLDLIDEVNAWWQATEPSRRKRFAFVSTRLAHGPFHLPDSSLLPPGHPAPETTRDHFECMVIALDSLLDRLIRFDANDMDGEIDLDQTLIVFASDNGTPVAAAGSQPPGKVKGSTFEGGIRCP